MKTILLILTILITFSCTHTSKCERKLKYVLENCPSIVTKDSIEVEKKIVDTIKVAVNNTDTIFKIGTDTITIVKDKIVYKFKYNAVDSSLWFNAAHDTIRVPYEKLVVVKVPINDIISKEKGFNWWMVACIGLALLLVFLIVKGK